MIVFIYGTTAEAIKLAPIMRRLDARGIRYEHWLTMQHTEALRKILPQLGLREPDRIIADGNRGKPLRRATDVIGWGWQAFRWIEKHRSELKRSLPSNTVVVVHGDTMTSVVGAYIARRLRVPSAHVEAGLRSGNWRHPFPEELDRRIVGRMASVHYTPSEIATANLRGRENVVETHGNTVIDAVLDHDEVEREAGQRYALALLHRFEFISNEQLVQETIGALIKHSPVPIRLLVDAYNSETLERVLASAHAGDRVVIESKKSHSEFVILLKHAEFVVTDSGGVQEEAALLGIPTLVHRVATERQDGVGRNVVLSGWDLDAVRAFLEDPDHHRFPAGRPPISPSDIVVEDLIARGFGS
ncbi:UDP-N-acetylglucosamine 2-epimerase [Microbacterium sp. GCS4]|uniref:UDP-N-acetylglucosamine 2-epimerase n=1 Tax=Microbacterium sp. GCS4 TaxID=1692239 RepID=UPI000680482C|nr:UDP-N-acetylglucosamine 2-epimerase [Microbacterium sp. GCS4]KNY07437.1 hypothetical protein AKH00_03960 [Microbacterium sp. GCS4]